MEERAGRTNHPVGMATVQETEVVETEHEETTNTS